MSNMQAEVYHAFRSVGINEDIAAKAAAALNEPDKDVASLKADVSVVKFDMSVLKSDVSVLKSDVVVLKSDVSLLKSDVSLLKWMVGTNVTLTLLVLGKLFLIPG